MTVRLSRGTINRKTWKYCDQHQQMILKTGPCADAKCKGRLRERYGFCFTYQTIDGKTLRARGQAYSRAEAESAMEQRKAELAKAAEPIVAPPVTLNDYADKFLVSVSASLEGNTVISYRAMLANHIRPTLGSMPLANITRGDVKTLLATKRAGGSVKPPKETCRLIRATISALFVDAIDSGVVVANPAAKLGKVKTPDIVTTAERQEKTRAMSVDQLTTFLNTAAHHQHSFLWLTLADTGMRPGEALALRWTDLDLPNRQVNVSRALERWTRRVKGTKTGKSRVVDLTPRLTAALDQRQAQAEADALLAERDVPALVFHDGTGRPLQDNPLSDQFRRLCRRAGLPRFRMYDLRHTFASHLLAMGVPITYVAAQLGHSKPTMTRSAYAHFMPRPDRKYADQLEAIRCGGHDAPFRPQGTPPETPGASRHTTISANGAGF